MLPGSNRNSERPSYLFSLVVGTFHDHLFVDATRAQDAMDFIQEIASNASYYEELAKQSMEVFRK